MELANGKKNKFFSIGQETVNKYLDEEGMTDQYAYVDFLCEYIKDGSVVLDIGCGQGRFGRNLKKKKCTTYGIEIDPVAASYAYNTNCYEEVFIMDLSEADTTESQRLQSNVKDVDYIILSDVLEHLVNPTAAIERYYKFLKNSGSILVSVPNVANIDIILNLMDGKFNYTDIGILDNTHLKFFTKDSFFDWIYQINSIYEDVLLSCTYLGCTRYESDYISNMHEKYAELYNILALRDEYNSCQLFFELVKGQQNTSNSSNSKVVVVSEIGQQLKREKVHDELKQKDIYISELIEDREQKDKCILELVEDRKQKDVCITELNEKINEKEMCIQTLEKDNNYYVKYIQEYKLEIQQLQKKVNALYREIFELENSFFGKLSKIFK